MTETQLAKILHDAHTAYQRSQIRPETNFSAVNPWPSVEIRSVRFAEPTSRTWQRQHRDWRPAGYYRIHCSHDRLLWDVCGCCKRDKREANANFGKMARGDRF